MVPDLPRLAQRLRDAPPDRDALLAGSNQGLIHRLEHDGHELAIKTAAGTGLRRRINAWSLQRESRAYERLQGMAGIPGWHGLIDRRWLVLDFIELRPFRDSEVGPRYFEQLLARIREMHARGVAHGDLKRKANLAIQPDGSPLLLDFGASILRRPGPHPVNQRLFEMLRQTDLNAWVKLKYGGYQGVSEADRELLRRSWIERGLTRLRQR